MNWQNYRIVGLHGDQIKACAQFDFRGYTVSMSTMAAVFATKIAVYQGEELAFETDTVELAIEQILSLTA